jgi:predicted nuclease of restriction endonuclease-like RecB superfamily
MSKSRSDDTIENRVYLFDSLATSYISSASELLSSEDEAVRARAMRALADLAYVSCVVADTGHLSPEQVRQRVLGAPEPQPPGGDEADRDAKGKKRK